MTTTTLSKDLTPEALRIVALLRARQYEAVERAVGRAIERLPPGPHEPTWGSPPDRLDGVPRVVVPPTGLRLPTCTPAPSRVACPHASKVVASVAPYPDAHPQGRADGGRPRAERYRAFAVGQTVASALRRGATPRDVRWALAAGLLALRDPATAR